MVELSLVREHGGAGVADVTVHVPLDIVNLRIIKNVGDVFYDIIAHGRIAQIEHELISAKQRRSSRCGNREFRMRAVEVAVGIHHFRLKPETELKT